MATVVERPAEQRLARLAEAPLVLAKASLAVDSLPLEALGDPVVVDLGPDLPLHHPQPPLAQPWLCPSASPLADGGQRNPVPDLRSAPLVSLLVEL